MTPDGDEFDELTAGLGDVADAAVEQASQDLDDDVIRRVVNMFELLRRAESELNSAGELEMSSELRRELGDKLAEQLDRMERLLGH
jgi:hypothetical protein